jgi:hypothetical protein
MGPAVPGKTSGAVTRARQKCPRQAIAIALSTSQPDSEEMPGRLTFSGPCNKPGAWPKNRYRGAALIPTDCDALAYQAAALSDTVRVASFLRPDFLV